MKKIFWFVAIFAILSSAVVFAQEYYNGEEAAEAEGYEAADYDGYGAAEAQDYESADYQAGVYEPSDYYSQEFTEADYYASTGYDSEDSAETGYYYYGGEGVTATGAYVYDEGAAADRGPFSIMMKVSTPDDAPGARRLYHLLIIDRTRSPLNSDITDMRNITLLHTFRHGANGYAIVLFATEKGKEISYNLPESSVILVDLISERRNTITEYINSTAFRRFITNSVVTANLLNALR